MMKILKVFCSILQKQLTNKLRKHLPKTIGKSTGVDGETVLQWEYKVEMQEKNLFGNADKQQVKQLNEAGAEGWELVACVGAPGDRVMKHIYKRPIKE